MKKLLLVPYINLKIVLSYQERLRPDKSIPPIEQVGTYDPNVNSNGEKLVSLNLERITYYIGQGVRLSSNVEELLGTYITFIHLEECTE